MAHLSKRHGEPSTIRTDDGTDLYCFTETNGVVTTTMNDLPGYRIKRVLGTVYGMSVRSRNIGANIVMAFKSMAGGELTAWTKMLYSARNDTIGRVVKETQARGGNAVIALRFESGEIDQVGIQVCAYGTAVLVEKIDGAFEDALQLGH